MKVPYDALSSVLPLPVGPDHHSAKKATTQPKSIYFDHEIMENEKK
jgi:hypothetical protein